MTTFNELLPVAQTIVLLAGGIWAVSDIKGTTRVLSEAIDNLAERIDELKRWVNSMQDRTNEHSERIAKLEAVQMNGQQQRRRQNNGQN